MVHSTKSPSVSGSSPHLDEVRSSVAACSEYAVPEEQDNAGQRSDTRTFDNSLKTKKERKKNKQRHSP